MQISIDVFKNGLNKIKSIATFQPYKINLCVNVLVATIMEGILQREKKWQKKPKSFR